MCLLIPFINYFFQNNINFLMICLEVKHTSFHSEPYLYIVYTFTVLWMSYLSGYTTKVNAPSLKEEKFLQSSYIISRISGSHVILKEILCNFKTLSSILTHSWKGKYFPWPTTNQLHTLTSQPRIWYINWYPTHNLINNK